MDLVIRCRACKSILAIANSHINTGVVQELTLVIDPCECPSDICGDCEDLKILHQTEKILEAQVVALKLSEAQLRLQLKGTQVELGELLRLRAAHE